MLGEIIARGSRSVLREWGSDAVAKVPYPDVPDAWIRAESVYAAAAREVGAPVPEVRGTAKVNGRLAGISSRISGPSMWDALVDAPGDADVLAAVFAKTHLLLLGIAGPITLPSQRHRLAAKIRNVGETTTASRLPPEPERPVLCHGDFHPKNVILSPDGPVVVDWFDATRGVAAADVARTSLLLRVGPHLPGATGGLIARFHDAYLDALGVGLVDDVDGWSEFVTVARRAELEPPLRDQRRLPHHGSGP